MNINVPGTKVTPKMAVYVAKKFLHKFEEGAPTADLKSATCAIPTTGQRVFELAFHVAPPDSEPSC